ncbi:MAG: hypothetical protein JWO06_2371 [Bacteroidota bacterium]|nr:hypothetical protein [Bacteroidota bacterium]
MAGANKLLYRRGIFCLVLVLLQGKAMAGLFYEHKYIGDIAFKQFVASNHLEKFLSDTLFLKRYGAGFELKIPFKKNREPIAYYDSMFELFKGSGGRIITRTATLQVYPATTPSTLCSYTRG